MTSPELIQFADFEVDLDSQELRRDGATVPLEVQPFQVLALLLRQPGKVVTREALQQKLWPVDTFVDFDNAVNTAIRKIRRALEDSATEPRFVETLPKRGYRFIGEVKARPPAESPAPEPPPLPAPSLHIERWLIAALAVALAVVWATRSGQPAPASPPIRSSIPLPPGLHAEHLSISPDGQSLAVALYPPGPLLTRRLDSDQWQELPGTQGALYPFWSPTDDAIAYRVQGDYKKLALPNGPPQSIASVTGARSGSWGPSGMLTIQNREVVYTPTGSNVESRVVIASPAPGANCRFPEFLPDGRHFLYTVINADQEVGGIYVGSLGGEPPVRLLPDVSRASYAPYGPDADTGFLLFVREGALVAQRFDPQSRELSGAATALFPAPPSTSDIGDYGFSASRYRTLAVATSGSGRRRFVWLDRTGRVAERTDLVTERVTTPRLSADDSRLVYVSAAAGNIDIWKYEFGDKTRTRLSVQPRLDGNPIWSPDSSEVAFSSRTSAVAADIVRLPSDGSSLDPKTVLATADDEFAMDWSSDGKYLLFQSAGELRYLERKGDDSWQSHAYIARGDYGRFSPDGKYVAYTSDESGQSEVYVRSFPAGNQVTHVSSGGGFAPIWRRSGSELFYVDLDDRLTAAEFSTAAGFQIVRRTPLFRYALLRAAGSGAVDYDISVDGQRVLAAEVVNIDDRPALESDSPITLITDWPSLYGLDD